jgi:hypothetical protein
VGVQIKEKETELSDREHGNNLYLRYFRLHADIGSPYEFQRIIESFVVFIYL